jgi:hypothetical protein
MKVYFSDWLWIGFHITIGMQIRCCVSVNTLLIGYYVIIQHFCKPRELMCMVRVNLQNNNASFCAESLVGRRVQVHLANAGGEGASLSSDLRQIDKNTSSALGKDFFVCAITREKSESVSFPARDSFVRRYRRRWDGSSLFITLSESNRKHTTQKYFDSTIDLHNNLDWNWTIKYLQSPTAEKN